MSTDPNNRAYQQGDGQNSEPVAIAHCGPARAITPVATLVRVRFLASISFSGRPRLTAAFLRQQFSIALCAQTVRRMPP